MFFRKQWLKYSPKNRMDIAWRAIGRARTVNKWLVKPPCQAFRGLLRREHCPGGRTGAGTSRRLPRETYSDGLGSSAAVEAAAVLAHGVDQHGDAVGMDMLRDAMAKIEDVPAVGGVTAETIQHPPGFRGDALR